MDHTVCPGSKFIRQPKPEQFECPKCKGEVEIWSDEISGKCSACGTTVVRDGTMSCIEWCAMARDCVGDDAYNDFQDRKATTVKERLMELVSASGGDVDRRLVERSVFYAENIARSEEADLHVVLAGSILGMILEGTPERAREELLKLGFQIDDIEQVCTLLTGPAGSVGEVSINEAVIHDARILADLETHTSHRYAGDKSTDPDTVKYSLKTRSASELARHIPA